MVGHKKKETAESSPEKLNPNSGLHYPTHVDNVVLMLVPCVITFAGACVSVGMLGTLSETRTHMLRCVVGIIISDCIEYE